MQYLIDEEAAAAAAAAATAQVPARGPDVPLPGLGPAATWNDVYTWIEANSAKVRADVEAQVGTNGAFITLEIQTYVGSVVKAVSSYINNLYETLMDQSVSLWNSLMYVQKELQDQIDRQDAILTNLITSNYETREGIIPALMQQIANLEEEVKQRDLILEGQMQQWTEDNIYRPLFEQQVLLDQATKERELVLAQQQYQYADTQVQKEQWERVAAYLILQQQLNVIETEFETCVNDMCATQGPNTQLGKFLKALNLAADLALLTELANLNRAGVENLLHGFASIAGGAIKDFETLFVGGGESFGQVIGRAAGL